MRSVKSILSVCAQNFRKWQTDYRVWIIFLLMTIMAFSYADDMSKISATLGTPVPFWTFPFLYSQFYTKLIFTVPIVFLFCNAPFTDKNQIFMIVRAGRVKWLCGQILYIVLASAVYYLFLLLVSILPAVFSGAVTSDWGKTLTTFAVYPSVTLKSGTIFIEVNLNVITYFQPLQAVWFTFLMSWISAVILGLIIFLCNITTGTRSLGIIVSTALIAETYVVKNSLGNNFRSLIYFSPVSWNTLDCIDVGGLTKNPSFTYCITVYAVLVLVLIASIFIFGRKKSLDIKE